MRRYIAVSILVLGIAGVAAILAAAGPADPSSLWASIDFPGAKLTEAEGINPGGQIVGLYADSSGHQHGFLLSGGNFSSIDYPGSAMTIAFGINPGGAIVGDWDDGKGNGPASIHGFLLSAGKFSEVQFPGYLGTIAKGISPDGDIWGCNHNTDFMGSMHGFVRTRAGYAAIDVPASMSNGATPDGKMVVGLYTDMGTGLTHAYVIDGGNFEPFDAPNSTLTQAWDVNPLREIVGNYLDTGGKLHGFLRNDSGFTTLDYPDAVATQARGINPQSSIVGFYRDAAGKTHGFLLTRAE